MSEAIRFNPDEMTLGDLETFEEIVGKPLDEAITERVVRDPETNKPLRDEKGKPKREARAGAKAIVAMVYLTKRRDNPDYTLEDARAVKVSELVIEGDDEEKGANPTAAAT